MAETERTLGEELEDLSKHSWALLKLAGIGIFSYLGFKFAQKLWKDEHEDED